MKRLLPVVLVVGVAAAVAWMARRPSEPGATFAEPAVASAGLDAQGPIALQFFRDPAAVAPFSVRDLDGREFSADQLKGKVTIVNYWATWCPPCRAEIPDLIALQEKYPDELQIIGVSEDDIAVDEVKRFAEENHFNYPVVMSSPELSQIFTGVAALPTSFILDPEGRIVQKHVGMLLAAYTEAETRHLAGLPVDVTVEEIDRTQGLKLDLTNAQLLDIPGVDLSSLSAEQRGEALEKLNSVSCTCGCELSVAKCRVDDPTCSVSLPMAQEMVAEMTGR